MKCITKKSELSSQKNIYKIRKKKKSELSKKKNINKIQEKKYKIDNIRYKI